MENTEYNPNIEPEIKREIVTENDPIVTHTANDSVVLQPGDLVANRALPHESGSVGELLGPSNMIPEAPAKQFRG